MKLKWHPKGSAETKDITQFASTVTWSGSAGQASRQIEVSIIYSPLDKNIPDINIKLGDRVLLYEDGKLLINAMVYNRERVSEQGTITYSGYDDLKRLCDSQGLYSFKNTTPERITRTVCNDINIPTGDIIETKIPIKKLIIDSEESFYKIIMKAYTKAYKSNGKKYMPIMVNRKLFVIEKGEVIENFTLNDQVNITGSSYSESIEGMVNKIKIYDDKGKQIGEVKNSGHLTDFGTFQGTYTKEDGVNSTTAATNMLKGITQEASVEALGNIQCISGYGIKIKDTITKLTGKFWIDTDSHTWQDGTYTMSLDLTFKNLMDIEEEETSSKSKGKKKTKKKSKSADGKTIVYITAASSKYHSYKTCSGMIDCIEVTKSDAIKRGKGQCTKCWG